MKSIIPSLLVLAAATFAADGRGIDILSFRELYNRSDVIVVAKPISTKDTAERTSILSIHPAIGLSSEFEISAVLKGDNNLKKLVLHHYRLANPNQMMGNGPILVSFDTKHATRFLLFLQREPDGRYAPFNQTDPGWTAILKLDGPEWNKMELDDFKRWLDAKIWLNEQPTPGQTLQPQIPDAGAGELFEAIMNGKLDTAKELLTARPNLVFNEAGETPLHWAAQCDRKDMAELLLAHKADVNATSIKNGWTPLHYAVLGGHLDLAELLVAHKADVNANAKYRDERTPLHLAVENDHKDLAVLLLANHANVNARDSGGQTPLYLARSKDVAEVLLANQADVNSINIGGGAPLYHAVVNGFIEVASLLLSRGADVNAQDNEGQTPLHWAVRIGRMNMAALLLANKAEINAKDNGGRTPMHLAAMRGNQELFRFLLSHHADANAKDNSGKTPMDMVTPNGKTERDILLKPDTIKLD